MIPKRTRRIRPAVIIRACMRALKTALAAALVATPGGLTAQTTIPAQPAATITRQIYSAHDVAGWSLESELEDLRGERRPN